MSWFFLLGWFLAGSWLVDVLVLSLAGGCPGSFVVLSLNGAYQVCCEYTDRRLKNALNQQQTYNDFWAHP